MKKQFITTENLAYLGVLDDFYDLYNTAIEMYDYEWESSEAIQTNRISLIETIDNRLRPQIRKLLDSFLCKYTYLFTEEYPRLHPDSYMMKHVYVTDLKHDAPLHITVVTISFSTFLRDVLEPQIIHRVWTRVQNDRPNTPLETIDEQVQTHFCDLVETARNKICLHSTDSNHTPPHIIVFKALSAISCNLKGHFIEDCTIEVDRLEHDDTIQLPVHRCKDCGRLFIGNETLKQYEKVWGKLCISSRKDCDMANEHDLYTKESPLHQLGYNVIAGRLSEKERQAMLIKIYEKNWLTLFEIQRDIEKAIRIFQYRSRYQAAVKKWRDDLYFITEYVKNQITV